VSLVSSAVGLTIDDRVDLAKNFSGAVDEPATAGTMGASPWRCSLSRAVTGVAVVVSCLPLLGCYEEPVRDHLHVVFMPGPAIIVTAVQDIGSSSSAQDNAAVEARMDEARTNLDSGWDRWSRSISDLDPEAERSTVERHDGQARRGVHSALITSFRPLERFLGNQGLGAFYRDAPGVRELQLHPAGGGGATRQQRDVLDENLSSWSASVAAYLEAAAALYEYLDRAPERGYPCFAHIFDIDAENAGPLSDHEADLVRAAKTGTESVAEALLIPDGQAYSLNELSRLVFDTFQGRLTIAVDGPVLELEGFVEHELFLERPQVDLWGALEDAAGLWLSPDMVTALVKPGPAEIQPEPDPRDFAARPRRWSTPPDPGVVEGELRNRLRPESVYRVTWQTRPGPDNEIEIYETALAALRTAELDLPD
jgi:hypothetical protein